MPLSQIAGNLSVLASFPAFVLYYLFYSTFDFNDPEGRVSDTTTFLNAYDFIVIGAGSSGSVVANRLTEMSDWKVLLLEAGGDETIISDIPGVVHHLQRTNIDWSYKTVPQTGSCLAFKDNRCTWPRGKVLGGTSVLNYMVYARGNKQDYDQWEANGNPGWNPYIAANKKYHGTGGYLTVQEPAYTTPLVTAFIQAGVEMGYQNLDCNAAQQTGFMVAQATSRRGKRCSTAKAFLRPIRKRPNLYISMRSRVHKIIIDSSTKQATAVRFEKEGHIYEVRANKEIIVSAGTVNSPQLLMLSKIGPEDHLNSFGIPLMADLPVGDNLQDHIALGGMVFRINKPLGVMEARYYSLPSLLNYTIHGAGPLTSLGGTEGVAWVKTKYAPPGDWPDIQYHFVSATPASESGLFFRYNTNMKDSVWDNYYKPIVNTDMWQLIPTLLRPKSRGTIRLA
ncbi:hypothetical protein GHT06_020750 [Daphnia sinensis]|uniref:Glucose-methanol-choline oxidoreductase N-terminal domain-containing protein n=1 Tax=Daphnia sinensis TaxID=1820382 RepID=A0AAD5KZ71_9CRUS|nr:hypothetical protein GHT06_020750 [Daphnia sinensis]